LNFNETLQFHGIGTVLPWVIELVVYIHYLGDRGVFFLQVVLVGHSLGSINLLHAMENFTHKISLAIHVSGALLPSGVSFETTGDYFKGVSISPNSDSLTTYDPCQVL
jgi:predicted alpha/beta hydrolase family esterase